MFRKKEGKGKINNYILVTFSGTKNSKQHLVGDTLFILFY
jgi:hypothetical protein